MHYARDMQSLYFSLLAKLLDTESKCQTLVRGFAIDSRLVEEDSLFFALPGESVDGHDFLKEVAAKGALGAVVQRSYDGEDFGLELIRVDDVREALQKLARKVLEKRKSQVVAITGSMGKTTTKGFITTLLEGSCHFYASPKSYNSQVTLPLSILNAEGDAEVLILEMGMSEPGQIEKLVSIAPPDIAVLTTVALQHMDLFPEGLLAICEEKSAIFSHPRTKVGIVSRDIPHFAHAETAGNCPKTTFSKNPRGADYSYQLGKDKITVTEGKTAIDIPLALPMAHHYHNFVAAVIVARKLGLPWEVICQRAPLVQLPPMRFEKVEREGIVFINDAYNANPEAMRAALHSLPEPKKGGKRIGVIGGMNALGRFSEEGHKMVGQESLHALDVLLCLGEQCLVMKEIWDRAKRPAFHFATREELEQHLKGCAAPGDVVLLKGARAHALDEILNQY
ncbi:MAG: UDP-N-acetylmuramoyl-tripeptide--D-alanyl-D-alanine ligase [Chlamydiae bacterium]|nr:UDP-N-acetylmuramoyl-tripeptide--D-alanyl-D-alanine ligase [Chlamydiota bacterium]